MRGQRLLVLALGVAILVSTCSSTETRVPTLSISGLMKELQDEKTNITSIRERLPQMITELGLAGYDEASQEMSLEEMEEIFTPKQHVKRLVTGEGSGTKPLVYQGVQGRPGVDFPVLPSIPRTDFSCRQVKHSGYYADLDTDCQVFHICADGRKISFLCPNGTIFRQSHLICDWWWTVDCASSKEHYEESAEQLANDQKVYRARADALAQSRSRQQVGRKPGVIREQESGDRQGRVISNERPRQLTYTNVRRANNGRQGRVLGSTQESETQRSNSPFQTPFSTARPRNFQPSPFPTPFSPSAASQQISTEQQFDIKQPSESRQPTGNLQLPEDLIPPQESQFESNRDFEQSENYSDQLVGLKPPPEKLILIVPNQQPQQTKQRSDFLQRNLPSSDRSFQRQTNQNKDSLQNRQPKLNSDFEQNRSPFRNQQVPQDQQRFPAVLPTPNRPLPQLRPSQPTRRPVTPPQQNRPSQEFRPTPQTRSSQTNRFDSNRQQLEIQNTRFSTNTQLSEPQDFLRSQNALRAFQFDQLQKQEQELHSSNGTKTYNHVRYFGSETEQQQPAETGSFVGNRGNNLLLNSGQQQPFRPPFRNADNIKQKERLRFLGSPTTARNIVSTQKVASFEKSFADKHMTRVTPKPILDVAFSRRVKPTVIQSFNRSSLVRNLVKNESETPIMEPEPPLNLRFSDEDDFEQAITEQEPPEGREFIDEDEFLNGITEPTPLSGEEFTEEEFTNSTETGQSVSEDLEEEDSEDDDFEDENQSNEEEAIFEPQPPEGKSFTSEDDSNNESKELALDLEPPFESSTVEYVSEEDIDSTNSSFPLTTPQTTSRKSRFRAQKSSLTTTSKIPSATSSTTVRSTRRKQLNVTPISNESMSSEEHSDLGEVNSENVTLTTDLEPPFDDMIIDIPKKNSSVLTSATIENSKSALRTSRFRTRTSTQSESSSETTTAPISTLAIGLSRRVKPAVVKSVSNNDTSAESVSLELELEPPISEEEFRENETTMDALVTTEDSSPSSRPARFRTRIPSNVETTTKTPVQSFTSIPITTRRVVALFAQTSGNNSTVISFTSEEKNKLSNNTKQVFTSARNRKVPVSSTDIPNIQTTSSEITNRRSSGEPSTTLSSRSGRARTTTKSISETPTTSSPTVFLTTVETFDESTETLFVTNDGTKEEVITTSTPDEWIPFTAEDIVDLLKKSQQSTISTSQPFETNTSVFSERTTLPTTTASRMVKPSRRTGRQRTTTSTNTKKTTSQSMTSSLNSSMSQSVQPAIDKSVEQNSTFGENPTSEIFETISFIGNISMDINSSNMSKILKQSNKSSTREGKRLGEDRAPSSTIQLIDSKILTNADTLTKTKPLRKFKTTTTMPILTNISYDGLDISHSQFISENETSIPKSNNSLVINKFVKNSTKKQSAIVSNLTLYTTVDTSTQDPMINSRLGSEALETTTEAKIQNTSTSTMEPPVTRNRYKSTSANPRKSVIKSTTPGETLITQDTKSKLPLLTQLTRNLSPPMIETNKSVIVKNDTSLDIGNSNKDLVFVTSDSDNTLTSDDTNEETEEELTGDRSGLFIPTSLGPRTLHTFSVYFSNKDEVETVTTPVGLEIIDMNETSSREMSTEKSIELSKETFDNQTLSLPPLLTKMTRNSFSSLFSNTKKDSTTSAPSTMTTPTSAPSTVSTTTLFTTTPRDILKTKTRKVSSRSRGRNNRERKIEKAIQELEHDFGEKLSKSSNDHTIPSEGEYTINVTDTDNSLADPEEKLLSKDTPNLRVLAQVFSRALSAYLDDPDEFRKALSEVRPTEPDTLSSEEEDTFTEATLSNSIETTSTASVFMEYPSVTKEEYEVLDFSDVTKPSTTRRKSGKTRSRSEITKSQINSGDDSRVLNAPKIDSRVKYSTSPSSIVESSTPNVNSKNTIPEYLTNPTRLPLESLQDSQSQYFANPSEIIMGIENSTNTPSSIAQEVNNVFGIDTDINEGVSDYTLPSGTKQYTGPSYGPQPNETIFAPTAGGVTDGSRPRYGGFQNNSIALGNNTSISRGSAGRSLSSGRNSTSRRKSTTSSVRKEIVEATTYTPENKFKFKDLANPPPTDLIPPNPDDLPWSEEIEKEEKIDIILGEFIPEDLNNLAVGAANLPSGSGEEKVESSNTGINGNKKSTLFVSSKKEIIQPLVSAGSQFSTSRTENTINKGITIKSNNISQIVEIRSNGTKVTSKDSFDSNLNNANTASDRSSDDQESLISADSASFVSSRKQSRNNLIAASRKIDSPENIKEPTHKINKTEFSSIKLTTEEDSNQTLNEYEDKTSQTNAPVTMQTKVNAALNMKYSDIPRRSKTRTTTEIPSTIGQGTKTANESSSELITPDIKTVIIYSDTAISSTIEYFTSTSTTTTRIPLIGRSSIVYSDSQSTTTDFIPIRKSKSRKIGEVMVSQKEVTNSNQTDSIPPSTTVSSEETTTTVTVTTPKTKRQKSTTTSPIPLTKIPEVFSSSPKIISTTKSPPTSTIKSLRSRKNKSTTTKPTTENSLKETESISISFSKKEASITENLNSTSRRKSSRGNKSRVVTAVNTQSQSPPVSTDSTTITTQQNTTTAPSIMIDHDIDVSDTSINIPDTTMSPKRKSTTPKYIEMNASSRRSKASRTSSKSESVRARSKESLETSSQEDKTKEVEISTTMVTTSEQVSSSTTSRTRATYLPTIPVKTTISQEDIFISEGSEEDSISSEERFTSANIPTTTMPSITTLNVEFNKKRLTSKDLSKKIEDSLEIFDPMGPTTTSATTLTSTETSSSQSFSSKQSTMRMSKKLQLSNSSLMLSSRTQDILMRLNETKESSEMMDAFEGLQDMLFRPEKVTTGRRAEAPLGMMNLNESSTTALLNVMKDAATNSTVRRLVLLLVNDSLKNNTLQQARIQLVEALISLPLEYIDPPVPGILPRPRSRQRAEARPGMMASRAASLRGGNNVVTSTTEAEPETTVLPPQARRGRTFSQIPDSRESSSPMSGSSDIFKESSEVGIETSSDSGAPQTISNASQEDKADSDTRAVELLQSLFTLASRWG